ncbi:MAG: hypothetical protein JWL86_5405 [Rhizobium sp.]|nr:hypothetical protein [Rhizobium sp.]
MNEVAHVLDPNKVQEIAFSPDCRVNVSDKQLLDQVAENIRRGLPQAMPYQPNPDTAIIVAGGPSLKTTEKDLVEAIWKGGKVIAVNGAYQWCIDRNIRPSACVVMDAREFNSRFVQEPVHDCHYLLASQCHPKTFEMCRDRNTTIWHALSAGDEEVKLLEDYYFKRMHPVTIGVTVTMRAISLMRMLGFMRMEIFGLDSCWSGEDHHAYEQKENNGEKTMSVWVRPQGRDDLAQRFICSVWQAKQAEDFMQLIKERGDLFQLNVHGPGLIATMVRTGAELEIIEEK